MATHAKYRIGIKGRVSRDWENWFSAVRIEVKEEKDGSSVTYLESPIIDQTALHGLLEKIRDLNLILFSVNIMDPITEEEL